VDRIYVHSPARLARNYAYQVLLIDEWRRAGVEVVFLNRSLGKSPEDDLLLQVQGIVSEYERAKIMERSRRGKKHTAQRGSLNVMSNAPFGYRYITVHDGGGEARFEVIPEQAAVIRDIFQMDRTGTLLPRRGLPSSSKLRQDHRDRKARLVSPDGMAYSPESRVSGNSGLWKNAHDAAFQKISSATAQGPTGRTPRGQYSGNG
jgi:hypothetical protein